MKIGKFFTFLLISIICITIYAKDTTIILQNGLNGYFGCIDSYVYRTNYAPDSAMLNYGNAPEILIHREAC
jgi:hypothetical protein